MKNCRWFPRGTVGSRAIIHDQQENIKFLLPFFFFLVAGVYCFFDCSVNVRLQNWPGASRALLFDVYVLNSVEVNCGPLSVTISWGIPWFTNVVFMHFMIAADVVLLMTRTSGHREQVSTMIKRLLHSGTVHAGRRAGSAMASADLAEASCEWAVVWIQDLGLDMQCIYELGVLWRGQFQSTKLFLLAVLLSLQCSNALRGQVSGFVLREKLALIYGIHEG